MNGLDGLFTGLPEWASWIALIAVVALILWRNKGRLGGDRNTEHNGQAAQDSRRGDTARSLARLRTDQQQSTGQQQSQSQQSGEDRDSPGRNGSGATRDLSRAEIRGLQPEYAPHLDGEPDPGEVVWTWVPYVENNGQGKDRPVLIIARIDDRAWAGCYLSTKQHHGFVSVGSGPWDAQGRESFLSPERVLRITEQGMRRESTGVTRANFERAVQAVRRHHGG